MTKKYKLIKVYPNSPLEGTIAIESEYRYDLTFNGRLIDSESDKIVIENFPEYWKLLVTVLTTRDGVEIYDGDINVVYINKFNEIKDLNPIDSSRFNYPNKDERYFSSRKKAEEWLIDNKDSISINDLLKLTEDNTVGSVGSRFSSLSLTKLRKFVQSKIK